MCYSLQIHVSACCFRKYNDILYINININYVVTFTDNGVPMLVGFDYGEDNDGPVRVARARRTAQRRISGDYEGTNDTGAQHTSWLEHRTI